MQNLQLTQPGSARCTHLQMVMQIINVWLWGNRRKLSI